jgi:hypothetical protein
MVVHPKVNGIIVLNGLLQECGNVQEADPSTRVGKVDPATRIPLQVDPQLLDKLEENDKRLFYRAKGVRVKPVARGGTPIYRWKIIFCNDLPSQTFGVGGVKIE